MIGGLLGQLQQQFQNRPNWQASMHHPNQAMGNTRPSTTNSLDLMYLMGRPGVQGANGLTPNYTGLFGMMGRQPQPIGNASGVSQGDYLSRVLAGSQQQQPQGLLGNLNPAALQAMMAGAPQNIVDIYQQYPNRSTDMLYWSTADGRDGG